MNEPLDPLDPELGRLLASERDAGPPQDGLDRVWSRIEGSLKSGLAGDPIRSSPFASHGRALAALAFVAGGALGATASLLLRHPVERVVLVDRPAPSVAIAPSTPACSERPPAPPVPAVSTRCAPAAVPMCPKPPRAPAGSSLAVEQSIVDDARTALARRDGATAIALADEHERLFPHAQLREEREAVVIEAMVLEGRYAEARARAAQFRAAFPDSLFLPAVEASLASIP
jgi:hypothetical protein